MRIVSNTMSTRRTAISSLAGAFSLGTYRYSTSQETQRRDIHLGSAISRRLRFTIQVVNPTSATLQNQTLWMYLPAHVAIGHELLSVDISSEHTIERDKLGHAILKIHWPSLPAFAQRVISVSCSLSIRSSPHQQQPGGAINWLQHERYIEVNDPLVQVLATQLKTSSQLQTVKNIYDWIIRHLTYAGFIADDLGARYALTERKGDCTEFAYLTVALARASGIPARVLGGYVLSQDAAPKADEYHNWAQVWINDQWLVLDPQKQNWLDPKLEYLTFRYVYGEAIHPIGLAHRYKVQGDLSIRT
jgi:hypothetical protein